MKFHTHLQKEKEKKATIEPHFAKIIVKTKSIIFNKQVAEC
jgi:hypothetical protein